MMSMTQLEMYGAFQATRGAFIFVSFIIDRCMLVPTPTDLSPVKTVWTRAIQTFVQVQHKRFRDNVQVVLLGIVLRSCGTCYMEWKCSHSPLL